MFFGGNLAFSVIVFGWLPMTFGLGWWARCGDGVGLAIGTLVTVPMALLGPRTGTNNTVSSGAHFGVTGRLVGSALTLAFALAYAAIAVWTSGDALVAGAHRLFGTPAGDVALAVGYALIATEIAAVALYGHGTVVALQKIVVPVVGGLLLLGLFAFAGSFDAGYGGGDYVLGGFWQTWVLAVTVAAAGPLSYAPSLGDYTRRISRQRYGDGTVVAPAATAGVFGGLLATIVDHAGLESVGLEWAAAINGKSPQAIRMLKYAFNLTDDGLVGQQLFAGEATRLAYMTDEAVEGRDAFLQKRDPDWTPFPRYF